MESHDEHLQRTSGSLVKGSDEATLETCKCRNCGNVAINDSKVNCKHGFCTDCIRDHFDNACPCCETEKIKQVSKDIEEIKEKMETMTNDVEKMKYVINGCEKMGTIFIDVEKLKTQQEVETESQKEFENEITQKVQTFQEKIADVRTSASQIEYIFGDEDRELELRGYTNNDLNFTWKIEEFKRQWKSHKYKRFKIFESNTFSDKESGLEFRVHLYTLKSSDLTVFVENYKSNPNTHFVRKFTLMDQSDRDEKAHITLTDTPKFSNHSTGNMGDSWFQCNTLVPKGLLRYTFDTYVKDDAIIIKISMIPLALLYKSVASDNGVLLWKIDNYSKKKQDEIDGVMLNLISNSFYTSPQGYRVQACLFLTGYDGAHDEYISLYLTFVAGEFDHLQQSPFTGMAKFILMDQSESFEKRHKCQEIFFYNSCGTFEGSSDFVLQSAAEKPPYLKDDSLLLKIVVKIPWMPIWK